VSYLVLARKWRPTRFDDVVGQRHITQTLQNSIRRDRVPHALLFIGSRGIGKTSCARIFAKALNCLSESTPVPTPCEQCTSCTSVNQGNAVDVFEIDGASNNGVEQVRELRESTRFTPSISRFKIYIIDEVHMLSMGAFNALLKTLEEPPPHVKFIFATTEPHKIPDTIISRCQRFDFKRIGSKEIVDALEKICAAESIEAERTALEHVAREAQGGMRDSLSLLDQLISFCGDEITESKTREIFGLTSREMMLSLISAVLRQDAAQVITLLSTHADAGADLKRLSAELLELLRDLMVIKVHPQPHKVLNIPPSELELAIEAAQDLNIGSIHQVFQTLIQRADDIQRSAHPKLLLEMSLLQMCHQVDVATMSEVMTGLLSLEQHLNQVGLEAGLPPLAPPPSYRPPPVSTYRAAPKRDHNTLSAQNTSQETHTEAKDKLEGFNSAQPAATQVVPSSESPKAEPVRPLSQNKGIKPNTQAAQVEVEVEVTPHIPSLNPSNEKQGLPSIPPSRTIDGLPKHPPLPADPQHIPNRAHGIDDLIYEWMSHFNHWLSQKDSFIAAEMRIKLKFLGYKTEKQKHLLTWGGPPDLIELFQNRQDIVTEQLINAASSLGNPLTHDQLQLEFVILSPEDPQHSYESLTEYAKRKRAIKAVEQVKETLQEPFIKEHLEALGGHVVYIVPQVLNH
jgi:DNA polymerase III subunit gamma/tau